LDEEEEGGNEQGALGLHARHGASRHGSTFTLQARPHFPSSRRACLTPSALHPLQRLAAIKRTVFVRELDAKASRRLAVSLCQ
jgi:hypothetical protein